MSNYFRKIMIVDDTETDRFLIKKILEKGQFADEFIEAESGMRALDMLTNVSMKHEEFPELIFLDVNMPSMTGFQFLDVFSALSFSCNAHFRIVMICSINEPGDRERAFTYKNVVGFYSKPLTEEGLAQLKGRLQLSNAS